MSRRPRTDVQPDLRADYWDYVYSEYCARMYDRAIAIKRYYYTPPGMWLDDSTVQRIYLHPDYYQMWLDDYEQPGQYYQSQLVYKRGKIHTVNAFQLSFLGWLQS